MPSRANCCICRKRKVAIWVTHGAAGIDGKPAEVERHDIMCKVCINAYEKAGTPRSTDFLIKWVAKRIWSFR